MADERQGVTRRDAIRSTAVAAGLVWTAPVVKSVRLLATSGTPAPPTSSTEPTRTQYTFETRFGPARSPIPDDATCWFLQTFAFTAVLSSLGLSDVTVHLCGGLPNGGISSIETASLTVISSGGSLNGVAREPPPLARSTFSMAFSSPSPSTSAAVRASSAARRALLTSKGPLNLRAIPCSPRRATSPAPSPHPRRATFGTQPRVAFASWLLRPTTHP